MEERVLGMKPLNYPPLNFRMPCPLATNIWTTCFFSRTCLDIPKQHAYSSIETSVEFLIYAYIYIYISVRACA